MSEYINLTDLEQEVARLSAEVRVLRTQYDEQQKRQPLQAGVEYNFVTLDKKHRFRGKFQEASKKTKNRPYLDSGIPDAVLKRRKKTDLEKRQIEEEKLAMMTAFAHVFPSPKNADGSSIVLTNDKDGKIVEWPKEGRRYLSMMEILTKKLSEEFPAFGEDSVVKLRVKYGPENKFHFVEEVKALDQVQWYLDVTLKSLSDEDWLREELKKGFASGQDLFDRWSDENSQADRAEINERYGFSS